MAEYTLLPFHIETKEAGIIKINKVLTIGFISDIDTIMSGKDLAIKLIYDSLRTPNIELETIKQTWSEQTIAEVVLSTLQTDGFNEEDFDINNPDFNLVKSFLDGRYYDFQNENKQFIKNVRNYFKQFLPQLAAASKILENVNWWIVDGFSLDFYVNMAQNTPNISEEELNQKADKLFNKYKSKKLEDIITKWNMSEFTKRLPQFKQALKAHKLGHYDLVVTFLILQPEGIIRDFVANKKSFANVDFKKVSKIFEKEFHSKVEGPTKREFSFRDEIAVRNYYNLKALSKLYAYSNPSRNTNTTKLKRHLIAHGGAYNATRESSTKLFLQLDMLHSMLEQLALSQEEAQKLKITKATPNFWHRKSIFD